MSESNNQILNSPAELKSKGQADDLLSSLMPTEVSADMSHGQEDAFSATEQSTSDTNVELVETSGSDHPTQHAVIDARANQLLAVPEDLELMLNSPQMFPLNMQTPAWFRSFEEVPRETFDWIEYQLVQLNQSPDQLQHTLLDEGGVLVDSEVINEIVTRLNYVIRLVAEYTDHPETQSAEKWEAISEVASLATTRSDFVIPPMP